LLILYGEKIYHWVKLLSAPPRYISLAIGGVAAYHEKISVIGVGYDIGCGNAAIRTNLSLADISNDSSSTKLNQLADEITATVSFGIGRSNRANDAPVDHPLFESNAWSLITDQDERESLREKARNQLGTVGSGNHYVDVFADEVGTIWVGVHFGSRGFGHTVASGFLNLSQGKKWGARGTKEVEILLPLNAIAWPRLLAPYAAGGAIRLCWP